MLICRVKRMLKARVEQVGAVADKLGYVSGMPQNRGDVIGPAQVNGLPPEVWPTEDPGGQVRAMWYRREAPRVKAFDARGPFRGKPVEFGRPNGSRGLVSEIVVAERIRDE